MMSKGYKSKGYKSEDRKSKGYKSESYKSESYKSEDRKSKGYKIEEQLKEESLIDHLRELRKRMVYIFIGATVGAVACWFFKEILFDFIRQPIEPFLSTDSKGLVYTGIMESFVAYIKICLLGGVILSCPFWLYHLWKFIAPALYTHEKRYGIGFIFSGTILFFLGISFVYYFVYPIAFKFLLGFGSGQDQALITINDYLSFFLKTTFLFGLAFEVPLVLTFLGLMGIIDADFLAKNRRYAVLALCLFSAVLTPPDPASMLMMALPLGILYESSIWSIRILKIKTKP